MHDDEPFKTLNIKKRGFNEITFNEIPVCYNQPIPISAEKKKDLISMLPLIDKEYHNFYESLQTIAMLNYHPDLTENDDLDEE